MSVCLSADVLGCVSDRISDMKGFGADSAIWRVGVRAIAGVNEGRMDSACEHSSVDPATIPSVGIPPTSPRTCDCKGGKTNQDLKGTKLVKQEKVN